MSDGTDRDGVEPTDDAPAPDVTEADEDSSGEELWPVWGGGGVLGASTVRPPDDERGPAGSDTSIPAPADGPEGTDVDESTADEPAAGEGAADEATSDEPAAAEPDAEEPAAEEPADEPAAETTAVAAAATAPAAPEAGAVEPESVEPVSVEPETAEPESAEPETAAETAAETADEPVAAETAVPAVTAATAIMAPVVETPAPTEPKTAPVAETAVTAVVAPVTETAATAVVAPVADEPGAHTAPDVEPRPDAQTELIAPVVVPSAPVRTSTRPPAAAAVVAGGAMAAAAAAGSPGPPSAPPAAGATPPAGAPAAATTPAATTPGATAAAATAPAATSPAATATASPAPAALPAAVTGEAATPLRVTAGPVTPTPRKESPLDMFESDHGKRRWPKRLAIIGIVVVVLGGGYVAASYALADQVPRGASVAGVDIGGLSSDAAVAQLDDELHSATTGPIDVVANDVTSSIDPEDAGLTFDARGTVDQLTGVNLAEPQRLWQHVVGVGEAEPVTSVDDEALTQAVEGLEGDLSKAPVDGSIVFVDGSAQATKAEDGWTLDADASAQVIEDEWLTGARPLSLPTEAVAPDTTQAETDEALAVANQAVSGPVSVTIDDQLAVLTPDQLSAAASMVPVDGALTLQLEGKKLAKDVLDQLPKLLTKAADASFTFKDDKPVLVPGKPGTTLDPDSLATAVGTAAVAAERNADVTLVETDPKESTDALKKLGIKEIVSEFSTPMPFEPRRTANIKTGLAHITGTLVRPGETFSLTDALGPVDAKHGFIDAGAIVSGEHVDAIGGGLSQVSTTTYNAAFFAGMENVTHTPHSEWFSRYPEGRESTIFTGVIDMKWKNNTPYGALVQGWVADGRTYVRIWGTKYWTVKTTTSPRSGVVSPTTVYSQSPTCEPALAGNPGFSVTVTRKTYLDDVLKKTESSSWRYKPQNKVVCGEPPSSKDDDE